MCKGREFKIYCKEVSDDGSEFKLVLEIDGKVEKEKCELWSFDDVLSVCYNFFKSSLEEYNFDGRFDNYEMIIYNIWLKK